MEHPCPRYVYVWTYIHVFGWVCVCMYGVQAVLDRRAFAFQSGRALLSKPMTCTLYARRKCVYIAGEEAVVSGVVSGACSSAADGEKAVAIVTAFINGMGAVGALLQVSQGRNRSAC